MRRPAVPQDAWLYGSSTVISVVVASVAAIPIQREWGRLAAVPYAMGAVAVVAMAWRGSGDRPERVSVRARTWVALLVLVGATVVPVALEAVLRSHTSPGRHAQSEVIVTEEGARALLDGRDPYGADFSRGPLEARPIGTRTHFPYLPAMLSFGIPRAVGGSGPLADARVAFAATCLGLAAMALLRTGRPPASDMPSPPHRRLTAFQVLAVLPTGALLLATGGDDLPVLALMLLSLVLARADRPVPAGLVAGLAAAMKQTAWPLLPFLAVSLRRKGDRSGPARFLAAAGGVAGAFILPMLAWDPAAFVEDVIKFPLGLGTHPSAAETPTLGGALTRWFPGARTPITVTLAAAVGAGAVLLLVRRPASSAAQAAAHTGLVLGAAFLLAPAARFGYVVYPINLLTWAWMLRPATPDAGRAASLRNSWRTARSRPGGGFEERSSPA